MILNTILWRNIWLLGLDNQIQLILSGKEKLNYKNYEIIRQQFAQKSTANSLFCTSEFTENDLLVPPASWLFETKQSHSFIPKTIDEENRDVNQQTYHRKSPTIAILVG